MSNRFNVLSNRTVAGLDLSTDRSDADLRTAMGLGGAALLNVGVGAGKVAAGDDSRLSDARTPTSHAASHGSAGADAITIASSQVTGLGGAALLNVGVGAGKVAAGDDSRIVGAVQTSRIFGGLDLSADRSIDAVNASLNARSEFTLASGWTDVISSGSITRAGGVTTLGVSSGGLVRQHRATIATPESPNIEIIGRFVVTSTIPPPTVWHTALMLADDAINYGFMVLVFDNAGVGLYKGDGAGLTLQAATGANAVVFTGSSWVRLVVTPSYASASYGTSATSTPPTSWTVAATAATTVATLAGGWLNRIQVRMGRTATGSGTYTCEWRNVQARILGSAP